MAGFSITDPSALMRKSLDGRSNGFASRGPLTRSAVWPEPT
jgi:hypothetical protein